MERENRKSVLKNTPGAYPMRARQHYTMRIQQLLGDWLYFTKLCDLKQQIKAASKGCTLHARKYTPCLRYICALIHKPPNERDLVTLFYKEQIEDERTISSLSSMQEMELRFKPSIPDNGVFLHCYPISLKLLLYQHFNTWVYVYIMTIYWCKFY